MRRLSKKLLYNNVISGIERDINSSVIGGAAVLVAQGGEILLDEARGYSNVMTGEPLKRDSVFRLASMTKPVTAVAALIAVERGWFGLYDRITDYFPEFSDIYVGRIENSEVVPDHKPAEDIRIYNFLTHTSGFMASGELYSLYEAKMPKSAYLSNEAAVRYCIENNCLTLEPVSRMSYCGYQAYDVVALLIERFSGMKYADFVKEEIFAPLGIRDITYHPSEELWARTVTMCDRAVSGMVSVDMGRHTFEDFPLTYTCAGAGLVGTIGDYHIFAEMLRGRGEYGGVRILKRETFDLLDKPYVPLDIMGEGAFTSWGLGVRVRMCDPVLPKGCFGWSGAYGTHFWVDPENDIVAIYMKNTRWHDSHGAGKTGRAFERAVYSSFQS